MFKRKDKEPDPLLVAAQKENESLLQQIHNLERRLDHKTEELELLQEGQSMMQQQLRAAYDKVPELNLQRERALATVRREHEAEVAALNAKLAQAQEAAPRGPQTLSSDAGPTAGQVAELEAQVAALKAQLSQALEAQAALASLPPVPPPPPQPLPPSTPDSSLADALAAAEARAAAAEAKSQQLFGAGTRIRTLAQALTTEVESLKHRCSVLEGERDAARAEAGAAMAAASEARAQHAHGASLVQSDDHQAEIAQLQSQLRDAGAECDRLRQQVESAHEEMDRAHQQLQAVESSASGNDSALHEALAAARADVRALQQQCAQLSAKLEQAERMASTHAADAARLKQELSDAQYRADAAVSEVSSLRARADAAEREAHESRMQAAQVQDSVSQAARHDGDVQQVVAEQQQRSAAAVAELKQQLDAERRTNGAVAAAVESLQLELDAARAAAAAQADRLATAEAQRDEAHRALSMSRDGGNMSGIDQDVAIITALRSQLTAEQRRSEEMQRALRARERAAEVSSEVHAQWERAVTQHAALKAQLEDVSQRAAEAQERASSAQLQLAAALSALEERESAVRAAKAKEAAAAASARQHQEQARAASSNAERSARLHSEVVATLEAQLARAIAYAEERQSALQAVSSQIEAVRAAAADSESRAQRAALGWMHPSRTGVPMPTPAAARKATPAFTAADGARLFGPPPGETGHASNDAWATSDAAQASRFATPATGAAGQRGGAPPLRSSVVGAAAPGVGSNAVSLAAHQNATARSLLAVSDRLVRQAQELGQVPPSTTRRALAATPASAGVPGSKLGTSRFRY